MTRAFADTSVFVAFLNPKDRHRESAVALLSQSAGRILTTEWVLAELGNYLSARSNRGLFVPFAFARSLAGDERFEIVAASPGQFEEGCALFDSRQDKEWSLTDCLSMVLMRQRGLTEVMTCDHHFEQAGFTILLK